MRKVQFNNKECSGEVVDFTTLVPGQWIVLKALDGTVIKVQLMVSELIHVKDEFYENGEPGYLVSWSIAQSVIGPDDVQRDAVVARKKKVQ